MSEPPRRPAPTGPEWVFFAVAVVLIVALAGVLFADWLAAPAERPTFEVRVAETREVAGDHQVDVDVTNAGSNAAAEVTVSAEYDDGDKVIELDQIVAFLAPDEEARVTFIFDEEPDRGRLSARVSSFREP